MDMKLPKLFAFLFGLLAVATTARGALPVTVLYSFPAGESPNAGLVEDANGAFYGTTTTGGVYNAGTIFRLVDNQALETLFQFDGTNGAAPYGSLAADTEGNFYGTTSSGGFQSNGTVFKISSTGVLTLLMLFDGTNGGTPYGTLVQGTNGYFYGTTFRGGTSGLGTIFEVAPGFFSNVFSFDGTDGANPRAGMIRGLDGNLYGTTQYGGANGLGTIFRFDYTNRLTTLVSFTNNKGSFPGKLIQDSNGNFFGTTLDGGTSQNGTIFELTSSNRFITLASFGITNGSNPNSPLALSAAGLLYGTTAQGGEYGLGTVFQLRRPSLSQINLTNPPSEPLTLFSFDSTNGAYPEAGLIQGSDGNFYGTTSSGGTNNSGEIFELSGFPPSILIQPTAKNYVTNGTATFSITAAGSAPLTYQWMMESNALSGGGILAGATNSTLTIHPETLAEAGTYYVVVTNLFGSIQSSNAVLAVPAATFTVRLPPATATNATLTVQGTARDAVGIASVQYQLNGGGFEMATTTNQWLDWSATVLLQPGSNVFQVKSLDPLGNASSTHTVDIFYLTESPLTLITNGDGIITRDFSGTNLVVGRRYVVMATPRAGNLFSNWSGTVSATNNPLSFLMQSNMVLQADFVTNFFLAEAGIYNGLFYGSNVTVQTAGMLSGLIVGPRGGYSGTLILQGLRFGLSGTFDIAGQATNVISRSIANGGALDVSITLNSSAITGQVSGTNVGGWTSLLTADRASNTLGSSEYTLLIPPATNSPPGYGYALLTNHAGIVFLNGRVADGTAFSQSVRISAAGDVPLYASLYGNQGLLTGWLNLSGGAPTGNLWWIKNNGFTNVINVEGSGWSNPPVHQPALTLSSGQLILSGGILSTSLVFTVSVNDNNTLAVLAGPTNSLSGSINPRTGLLKISFGNGDRRAVTTGFGAALQNSNSGGGYFGNTASAGSIILQP
jgi:uncharacterized repeat protein (TIGR03803 family)